MTRHHHRFVFPVALPAKPTPPPAAPRGRARVAARQYARLNPETGQHEGRGLWARQYGHHRFEFTGHEVAELASTKTAVAYMEDREAEGWVRASWLVMATDEGWEATRWRGDVLRDAFRLPSTWRPTANLVPRDHEPDAWPITELEWLTLHFDHAPEGWTGHP